MEQEAKLSVEELLRPRRKVTADYPNSPYRIGDVIVLANSNSDLWDCERTASRKLINPDTFPAIFKPMAWWEERKPEYMPEYLRCTQSPDGVHVRNEVYKVDKYKGPIWAVGESGPMILNTNCYTPATLTEYQSHLNTTNRGNH